MKIRTLITICLAALFAGACTIEPHLHLRKVVNTEIVMQADINTSIKWQVDWETQWQFQWQTDLHGALGYSEPTGVRMHVYTLDTDMLPKTHTVYNFHGLEGTAEVFEGIHNLLFHNNDSEALQFRSDTDLSDLHATTRIISSGLKTSIPVKTIAQKSASTKSDLDEIEEPVGMMPDELYTLYDPEHVITDNPADYEYIDGKYVLRIEGELRPRTFIYLFQVKLLNNFGRVSGSMGGAALTGMANMVNMVTGQTSEKTVSVPMNVYLNSTSDPDILGARVLTFGLPGCNPYDDASVAAAPEGSHWFVLNVNFATGKYKNIRIDVTDQVRALPLGGVISLEIDVEDFPPEDIDPPVDEGGGFRPLIGEWDEETGYTTITG